MGCLPFFPLFITHEITLKLQPYSWFLRRMLSICWNYPFICLFMLEWWFHKECTSISLYLFDFLEKQNCTLIVVVEGLLETDFEPCGQWWYSLRQSVKQHCTGGTHTRSYSAKRLPDRTVSFCLRRLTYCLVKDRQEPMLSKQTSINRSK